MDFKNFKFNFYEEFLETQTKIKSEVEKYTEQDKTPITSISPKEYAKILSDIHNFDIIYNETILRLLEKYHKALISYLSEKSQND